MHWLVPRLSWELLTSIDWIFTCTKNSTLTRWPMEIRTQVSCTYGIKNGSFFFNQLSSSLHPQQTCIISFCFGPPYFDRLWEGVNGKKTFSFGHCPNPLNPPPWPQFGQLGPLFSEIEIQDLKVSLELRILYILYNILYICNLKNS